MQHDATPPQSPAPRIIAGAMSGTSADGVDVALVEVGGRGKSMTARLLHHHHRPYHPDLRQMIFSMRGESAEAAPPPLSTLAHCTHLVSVAYAAAACASLAESRLAAADLSAVAAHGQTVYHAPPDTIQLLDPALLAAGTGCTVVSDFRRADCAAGGQGAPLVPFADHILFRHAEMDRAIVNIGGIANVTCLFAGAGAERVLAFDTGPGNCVSDHLIRQHDPAGPGVDLDGRLASRGRVSQPTIDGVLEHPYFQRNGPKSTDGPEMIRIFEQALRERGSDLAIEDRLATACALTAQLILRSLSAFGDRFRAEMIVSGGGTRNQAIMHHLRRGVGEERVRTTDQLGVPSEAKEAMAFALLGSATLDGIPSNIPSATGAKRAVVLGSITPRPE
jgi:anhydro-N-acetylmuramic acid kinase